MKMRNAEKKIYELLGVNIFRKYFLLPVGRLLNLFGCAEGYIIQNKTVDGLREFKFQTKCLGVTHLVLLLLASGCFIVIFNEFMNLLFILQLFINSYCIMTQRYNCIRIDEILEKHKELQKKRKSCQKIEKTTQKIEDKVFNYSISNSYQSEKVAEQTVLLLAEIGLSKPSELLEQEDSKVETGVTIKKSDGSQIKSKEIALISRKEEFITSANSAIEHIFSERDSDKRQPMIDTMMLTYAHSGVVDYYPWLLDYMSLPALVFLKNALPRYSEQIDAVTTRLEAGLQKVNTLK